MPHKDEFASIWRGRFRCETGGARMPSWCVTNSVQWAALEFRAETRTGTRASLAVLGRAPATVQLIHTMELSPIQRRQPHAAISTGNRAPVMKETASDMV